MKMKRKRSRIRVKTDKNDKRLNVCPAHLLTVIETFA